MYLKQGIFSLILSYKITFAFNYYSNICDHFDGLLPNTTLDQCPQAKFMTQYDYECYDKAYKSEWVRKWWNSN